MVCMTKNTTISAAQIADLEEHRQGDGKFGSKPDHLPDTDVNLDAPEGIFRTPGYISATFAGAVAAANDTTVDGDHGNFYGTLMANLRESGVKLSELSHDDTVWLRTLGNAGNADQYDTLVFARSKQHIQEVSKEAGLVAMVEVFDSVNAREEVSQSTLLRLTSWNVERLYRNNVGHQIDRLEERLEGYAADVAVDPDEDTQKFTERVDVHLRKIADDAGYSSMPAYLDIVRDRENVSPTTFLTLTTTDMHEFNDDFITEAVNGVEEDLLSS